IFQRLRQKTTRTTDLLKGRTSRKEENAAAPEHQGDDGLAGEQKSGSTEQNAAGASRRQLRVKIFGNKSPAKKDNSPAKTAKLGVSVSEFGSKREEDRAQEDRRKSTGSNSGTDEAAVDETFFGADPAQISDDEEVIAVPADDAATLFDAASSEEEEPEDDGPEDDIREKENPSTVKGTGGTKMATTRAIVSSTIQQGGPLDYLAEGTSGGSQLNERENLTLVQRVETLSAQLFSNNADGADSEAAPPEESFARVDLVRHAIWARQEEFLRKIAFFAGEARSFEAYFLFSGSVLQQRATAALGDGSLNASSTIAT
ncbi:unnamed protein product, partial [Amoebophrya sp. A25]